MPQGWRWLDSNGSSAAEEYLVVKNIIRSAEALGYETAYSHDHLMGGANIRANRNKPFFECYVLLASLLNITSRIRFSQLVTCNSYRNPALLAKMISTMDTISGGRIELGIGAGWSEDEYSAYGYKFPTSVERVRRLDEALRIIKLIYIEEEPSFSGKYYSIVKAQCYPKPVQTPFPPIMVGGTGEKYLLKTVARHANIYNHPFAAPQEVQRRLKALKDHCNSISRDYNDIKRSVVFRCLIRENEKDITNLILRAKDKHESLSCFIQRINAITGTPEIILRKMREYIDIGIEKFIIHFVSLDNESLELMYSKVVRDI